MRESAEFTKTHFNRPIVAAEIGVHFAANAKDLYAGLNCEELYLVDPYEKNKGYDIVQEKEVSSPEDAKKMALETMKGATNIVWIFEKSEDAASQLDAIFDYVYIDADHRYEEVKKDIACWYPKVKSGGILSGHDYHSAYRPDIHAGIDKAVDEFVEEYGLKLFCDGLDWWVIKP